MMMSNRRRWAILALVSLPVFIGALDLTIISAVLPSVVLDLEIPLETSLDDAAWAVSGYLMAYAITMSFMGRVSDLIGRLGPIDRIKVPRVVSQSIPPGTRIPKGTPVDLVMVPVSDIDFGLFETVHEDRAWIGHVNTSPTLPRVLTFCHEGPWDLVQQRIWGLDIDSGRTWKVRPQDKTRGEACGHEYWMADGVHVGYHGRTPDSRFFGSVRYDNAEKIEAPFPFDSHHFHSLSLDLIVGDGHSQPGKDYIVLWRFDGEKFIGPKALCRHRGSAHVQMTHVHPRLAPDGSYIVFTSDASGYGQVHTVKLSPFESLPDAT